MTPALPAWLRTEIAAGLTALRDAILVTASCAVICACLVIAFGG